MSHHLGAIILAGLAVASFVAFVLTGLWPFVVLEGLLLLVYAAEVGRQYG